MLARLILRSIAKRCVSKDGRQTRCSFPPFETHAFGALLRVRLFCVLALFAALLPSHPPAPQPPMPPWPSCSKRRAPSCRQPAPSPTSTV